jgi:copper homeostasis protein (lipoprotein)
LISIYKGKKPEKQFIKKGTYNLERGLEDDPDGTIYILNWDKPETQQIYYGYYSSNPEKVYLLNNKKKIIQSELNYSLLLNK